MAAKTKVRGHSRSVEASAREQVGDGKLPNKYWVSISNDYYYHNKTDDGSSVLDWASDREKFKVKGKTLAVFDSYQKAKDLFDSVELGSIKDGIQINMVEIEDRFTGQLTEKTNVENSRPTYSEDLSFTKKKLAELSAKHTDTSRIKKLENKVNSSNLVNFIMGYEGDDNFSADDTMALFSYLIRTGQAWSLQGSYGRAAANMIDSGYIDKKGHILKLPTDLE